MHGNGKIALNRKIKLLLGDSTVFLINTLRKKKKYLIINIISGLSTALCEGISISMIYLIINVLSSEKNTSIDWENTLLINNFDLIINFLESLSFKSVFICFILITLFIQFLQSLFKYINNLSTNFIEAALLANITNKIHTHIFNLSFEQSSKYKIGDLSEYISSAPKVIQVFAENLNILVVNTCISIVYVLFLIKLSIWNILVLFFIFIFTNKFQSSIFPRVRKFASEALNIQVELSKNIVENFQGLRFIHTNGLINLVERNITHQIYHLEKALKKTAIRMQLLPAFVSLSPIFLLALISILYGIYAEKGSLISTLGILLISIQRLNVRFIGSSRSLTLLAENIPKLERIISLFKKEDSHFRRVGGFILKQPFRKITFSKINFKYSKNASFGLKDISFSLASGKTTAIVGLSGAGKSSILDLLIGLFEPSNGNIYVDGYELSNMDIDKWQSQISIVSQDPFLLNASIIDNLKFGLPKVNMQDIKKACIDSGSNEFIENFSDGYNTIIGDRGFKLSGGERQRISIARALLKKSSLLILDEATSALDSKNEKFVKNNLDKIKSNKIILIIAHRLSTIKNSDEIIVLDNGQIIESGDHNFLLNKNGIYSQLWKIQSRN